MQHILEGFNLHSQTLFWTTVKLDRESLAALAEGTKDPAVALAANVILGETNWDQAFEKNRLSDVLGAVALVDGPYPRPSRGAVVAACHEYIRDGDDSRIPELRELLFRYGDIPLAEDYLNCGQSELGEAAREWAKDRGYSIGRGSGSGRVRWGEHKKQEPHD